MAESRSPFRKRYHVIPERKLEKGIALGGELIAQHLDLGTLARTVHARETNQDGNPVCTRRRLYELTLCHLSPNSPKTISRPGAWARLRVTSRRPFPTLPRPQRLHPV